MIRKLFYALLTISAMSCQNKKELNDAPLIAVIKLHSSESLADFEEAKKYIDVDKAYSKFANDSLTAENAWRENVTFNQRLAQDQKFTNVFKYFNYNISQIVEPSKAEVIFEAKDQNAKLKKIIYYL